MNVTCRVLLCATIWPGLMAVVNVNAEFDCYVQQSGLA